MLQMSGVMVAGHSFCNWYGATEAQAGNTHTSLSVRQGGL